MDFELKELVLALQSDNEKILEHLINTGLQLDMKIHDPHNSLHPFLQFEPPLLSVAAFYGARKCFRIIAGKFPQFFVRDKRGMSLAHFSILGGDCDIIDLLFGFGLEFDKCLPFAAQNGNGIVFRFLCQLLDKDLDINEMDSNGMAAIHYASLNGDYDLIKFLEIIGADLSLRNAERMTPLLIASKCGYPEIVQYLCNTDGIDINATDEDIYILFMIIHPFLWQS